MSWSVLAWFRRVPSVACLSRPLPSLSPLRESLGPVRALYRTGAKIDVRTRNRVRATVRRGRCLLVVSTPFRRLSRSGLAWGAQSALGQPWQLWRRFGCGGSRAQVIAALGRADRREANAHVTGTLLAAKRRQFQALVTGWKRPWAAHCQRPTFSGLQGHFRSRRRIKIRRACISRRASWARVF